VPRTRAYALVAVIAALPRLVVLVHERGRIMAAFTDKSDDFASTFVHSGTFGFLPGHPSAYTQPLYGFFLVPLYWIFGRHWLVVGLAQIAVAVGTAILVYEIGRRIVSATGGIVAAAITTLHPYLIWHDVHLNREILDQFLAAAVVLLTLVVTARPVVRIGALLGIAFGLSILANVRLAALPLVVGAFVLWQSERRRAAIVAVAVSFAVGVIVVAPWLIRNSVSVGCFAVTTDARALWKANNANTYTTLTHGGWIDDVPPYPGAPPTPQDAAELYKKTGKYVAVDECAQMRFFSHKVHAFWLHHAGEKAKLALLAGQMEWQPSVVETSGRSEKGTLVDTLRTSSEPLFVVPIYLLAVAGLFFVPRAFAVLVVSLAAYQTAVAMIFVGVTRYRVPWDFLLCVLASASILELARRVRELRRERPVAEPRLQR
jgi:4-amino-4-deoxy-L-arabinose transferase-like glycosyltransferase